MCSTELLELQDETAQLWKKTRENSKVYVASGLEQYIQPVSIINSKQPVHTEDRCTSGTEEVAGSTVKVDDARDTPAATKSNPLVEAEASYVKPEAEASYVKLSSDLLRVLQRGDGVDVRLLCRSEKVLGRVVYSSLQLDILPPKVLERGMRVKWVP